MIRYILLSGTFLILPMLSRSGDLSGKQNERRAIDWLPVYEKKFSEENTFKSLAFKGALYNSDYLPVFVETVKLNAGVADLQVELINVTSEPLLESNMITDPKKIPDEFSVTTRLSYRHKTPFANIEILPLRKSKNGGFEKLVSFDLKMNPRAGGTGNQVQRVYSRNSVLASGSWYKIGLMKDGVYRITYQQLKSMGMNPDSLDPRNIRLFGNGGGMLPYANYKPRKDDLQENAIQVVGESDGRFDVNDYVLFYGTEQVRWVYNAASGRYTHQINHYSDTTYYFLTADQGPGQRMMNQANSGFSPTHIINSFDDYQYHEADEVNLLKSGREWYGESLDNFNSSKSVSFFFPNLDLSDTVFLNFDFIGRATYSSSNTFSMTANGVSLGTWPFASVGVTATDNYARDLSATKAFFATSSTLNLGIQLASNDPNVLAWINYIELNVRRTLTLSGTGSQLIFRDSRSAGAGHVCDYRITGANTNFLVWDVTDPLNPKIQESTLNGNELSFIVEADQVHEFVTYNSTTAYSPTLVGPVENQNLHALPKADLVLVTNPLFLAQANELADFHRNHDQMTVVVATTQQVFNEFSSGSQDVSAIRDFVKMFYDRAFSPADMPHYLLLFGDASYDNKHRISSNSNYVTSYESAGSLNQTQTYMSDDFFGLLDDVEGDWSNGEIVDLSIGRLPVKSVAEATSAVQKIIHYAAADRSLPGAGDASAPGVFGDWRNVATFVADDQDSNTHFKQADSLAKYLAVTNPLFNIDKIYLDAYNQETTPGGQRYPDGHKAIVDRVQKGTLIMTYIGHGGELGWGHERFLEVPDINNWSNYDNLAAFLTATCEFTRVDDPGRTSAGELVFLNPTGGGICLFTTSRLAFSSSNNTLCQKFYTHILNRINGKMPTIGEIFEQTKIDVYSDQYVRNFLLIGDPALQLAYPQNKIQTNTVNGVNIANPVDTLKALSRITVTGEIQNQNGQKLSSFNGTLYPTVFDKSVTYYTLGNDINIPTDPSYPAPFNLQKNIIYKGKASVVNGDFSFTFMVPKDIQFQYGFGKLSYYAQNGAIDAAGYDAHVVVGGYNSSAVPDDQGPDVKLYLNDEKFVNGSMTDQNPVLFAIVKDTSGINTVGTGIGHDMTAELDNDHKNLVVLNDAYQNDLNSYQQGRVKYQFKNLASGPHTLHFKVWDVYNNSSEASTDFVVSESAELALEHVLNYPNPFTTHTTFMFEHNRPYTELDVMVQIFTVSGKLIKTLSTKITSEGFRFDNLEWDGLDDYGDRIGKGVYIYRLRVKSGTAGSYAEKFEKLVLLR